MASAFGGTAVFAAAANLGASTGEQAVIHSAAERLLRPEGEDLGFAGAGLLSGQVMQAK